MGLLTRCNAYRVFHFQHCNRLAVIRLVRQSHTGLIFYLFNTTADARQWPRSMLPLYIQWLFSMSIIIIVYNVVIQHVQIVYTGLFNMLTWYTLCLFHTDSLHCVNGDCIVTVRFIFSVPARHIYEGAAPCPYYLAPCLIIQRPARIII